MPTTQDNRLLAIHTPLGKDHLLIDKISGSEGLSRLFSYEVSLLHEETDEGFGSTIVNPASLLGRGVTVIVGQPDGTSREITGIINKFSQGNRNPRFTFYHAVIVPHVWILTQRIQSRIFQNMTVPDILHDIFSGFQIVWEIQGVSNLRNYCVQYRETDFDFVSRLMEEEGIYYYFVHHDGKHEMVIANIPQSHRDCPTKSEIPFFLDVTRNQEDFVSSIGEWRSEHHLQTGKVTFWDHNFQLPTKNLEHSEQSRFSISDNKQLEHYEFPGGYARKYDGIDKSGGEQARDLSFVDEDGTMAAKYAIEELDGRYRTLEGGGDCCAMTAGHRFTLLNHPDKDENGRYIITELTLNAEQAPAYVSDHVPANLTNSFTCISSGPNSVPFRPRRKTAKPVIQGGQTAYIVGPAGEEIFTDKYGRVKVQFHWDREGQATSSSSCWVRVAQTWAGNRWGGMFIPRIGMEVIVHFLEGDPDQPIITGCVYNPQAMPPYILPDEKTKSTLKSNSSKGGGGFNEFRFEDKKGNEQIFIHAEKNQDVRVRNDSLEYIGNDRHLIIQNEQFEKVNKDKHLDVVGDHNERVGGSISTKAAVDFEVKTGTKFAVDAGSEIHLKSGTSLTIETGASLTLKVGGNFININSAGIFIKGSMVMLNSGGAAGSGSGSNPQPPGAALEADKAEPGRGTASPPAQVPPLRPMFMQSAALVMINAAQNGAAFCEICSRNQ